MGVSNAVQDAANRLLARARTVDAQDRVAVWADDAETVARYALEAADRQAALAAKVEQVKGVLSELFDYTKHLKGASAAWFASRLYARHPKVADDLGERIRAALDAAPAVGVVPSVSRESASDAGEGERSCR
jgi:hypothetical protein